MYQVKGAFKNTRYGLPSLAFSINFLYVALYVNSRKYCW